MTIQLRRTNGEKIYEVSPELEARADLVIILGEESFPGERTVKIRVTTDGRIAVRAMFGGLQVRPVSQNELDITPWSDV